MTYPWTAGDVLQASDLNSAFGEPWQTPTYTADFSDYGGSYAGVEYRREADTVRVRGLAKAIATVVAGDVIFTFPTGYRPPGRLVIATMGAESATAPSPIVVEVLTDGNLQMGGGTNMVSGNYLALNFTFALS